MPRSSRTWTGFTGGTVFNVQDIGSGLTTIINDVRNIEILTPLIERAEVIFHLAAQVSYIDGLAMPYEDLDLNARLSLVILECCLK